MTVDVKELLDLYGYSASEFSKMTRIEYTRLLKLYFTYNLEDLVFLCSILELKIYVKKIMI